MKNRSVILRGDPDINEYGTASATVKPGYLVKGIRTIAHQTATTTSVPNAFALERDELGQGLDNSRQGSGTTSAFYASGDVVKVGVFDSGDELVAFVASGAYVEDDLLESAGDGTLTKGTTKPIARIVDSLGTVVAVTAVRVQIL